MHISSCLNPKRVVNKYTQEVMYVPCGKCEACLASHGSLWTQRLEQERYCWKYCLFFTLTYADEHLPAMMTLDDHLVPTNALHFAPTKNLPVVDYRDLELVSSDWSRDFSWLRRRKLVPYLSVYDVQTFIKRLRRNSQSYVRRHNFQKTFNYTKDALIRYFICGEYGPTTLRPHYHGLLFFNSEFEASYIEEVLRKAWKFGRVDTSFVAESNAAYVAKYVNCLAHLPSVYHHRSFRPFALCSKCPPIGTLAFNDEKVRKVFDECAVEFTIVNHRKNAFDNVPLWRTFRDRLFPKLTKYSEFSHADRVALYRAAEKYDTFIEFKDAMTNPKGFVASLLLDYTKFLLIGRDPVIDFMPLYNWYAKSRRVVLQSCVFDVSIEDYVYHIETFYNRVEYDKLQKQFEFQADYSQEHDIGECLGMDMEFLRDTRDLDIADLTFGEIMAYQSYGIDVEKFFSTDLSVREEYQAHYLPESSYDYRVYSLDAESRMKQVTKTKRKNDYLAAHPELCNILY